MKWYDMNERRGNRWRWKKKMINSFYKHKKCYETRIKEEYFFKKEYFFIYVHIYINIYKWKLNEWKKEKNVFSGTNMSTNQVLLFSNTLIFFFVYYERGVFTYRKEISLGIYIKWSEVVFFFNC